MASVEGKIILVDNEKYEFKFLELALQRKNWDVKVEYHASAKMALAHMKITQDKIFLIICDMHMPEMGGLDFKKIIDKDPVLRKKAIPFIFMSKTATQKEVSEAYEYRVQGYFKKPLNVAEQADMLDTIIKYWIICMHPNANTL